LLSSCAGNEDSGTGRDASAARDTGADAPLTDGGRGGSCSTGEIELCTTGCGTEGTRSCIADGRFSACQVPAEDCNGVDDDCDGAIDEGVDTRACSSECGGGDERCEAGAWSGCTPVSPAPEMCDGLDQDCDGLIDEDLIYECSTACGPGREVCVDGTFTTCDAPVPVDETCDGTDQDCDGVIDEGFRTTNASTTYTILGGLTAGCDGTAERVGATCNSAIHRFCGGVECATSGYGPVEYSGDAAYVACVKATMHDITFTTASAHHAACNGTGGLLGTACEAAYHRYCASLGDASGFGAELVSATTVRVACVDREMASVEGTTFTELTTHHPACTSAVWRGGACHAAVKRYCQANGFASGFGPVELNGDNVAVTCVRR